MAACSLLRVSLDEFSPYSRGSQVLLRWGISSLKFADVFPQFGKGSGRGLDVAGHRGIDACRDACFLEGAFVFVLSQEERDIIARLPQALTSKRRHVRVCRIRSATRNRLMQEVDELR